MYVLEATSPSLFYIYGLTVSGKTNGKTVTRTRRRANTPSSKRATKKTMRMTVAVSKRRRVRLTKRPRARRKKSRATYQWLLSGWSSLSSTKIISVRRLPPLVTIAVKDNINTYIRLCPRKHWLQQRQAAPGKAGREYVEERLRTPEGALGSHQAPEVGGEQVPVNSERGASSTVILSAY